MWVSEDDDTIVCALVLQLAPDHLLINNIAVAPAAQGKGVGAHLLAFAEAQARGWIGRRCSSTRTSSWPRTLRTTSGTGTSRQVGTVSPRDDASSSPSVSPSRTPPAAVRGPLC